MSKEEDVISAELSKIPGMRGRDIPEHAYDQMRDIADGITMPLWGRPATPYQMQDLYNIGATDPTSIHQAFAQLPHPHAPSVSVGEYGQYAEALKTYKIHS